MRNYLPGDPFKYVGTHRKPRGRRVARIASLAVPLTVAGAMLVGATPLAAHAATRVNWQHRTCAAYATWERHHTAAHLDALVADSFHVTDKYLASDAGQFYADVRGGGDTDLDRQYLYEDCNSGSGL